jgi:hypothetical protein
MMTTVHHRTYNGRVPVIKNIRVCFVNRGLTDRHVQWVSPIETHTHTHTHGPCQPLSVHYFDRVWRVCASVSVPAQNTTAPLMQPRCRQCACAAGRVRAHTHTHTPHTPLLYTAGAHTRTRIDALKNTRTHYTLCVCAAFALHTKLGGTHRFAALKSTRVPHTRPARAMI